MTIRELLRQAAGRLEASGVSSPRASSEWVLAHVLGCARFDLLTNPSRNLTEDQTRSFDALCRRLEGHEPLQYVLGSADFMGMLLQTDARALIPRPETEQLVEHVLASNLWDRDVPGRGVDVGTGSGCIVLALAARHSAWQWTAVDREEKALALARENARALGLEDAVVWRRGDLLEGFGEHSQDLVVSNPPYIDTAVCDTLAPEVRDYEPISALDGGSDGLAVIRRLVEQAWRILRTGGWIFLEIGCDQGHRVMTLLTEAGFSAVSVRRDRAGRERIAEGMKA